MAKFRILFFFLTIMVVGSVGYFLSFYAKGYRLDFKTLKFVPNGILVIKSNPDGASVFVAGELKTATNATINLPPNIYDVIVRKEGFGEWKKRLTIEKEVVTEADAHLYRLVPSLSAVTYTGITKTLPSPDSSKLAYIVPSTENNIDQAGLWVMETINLPLGFSRTPKRITEGNLEEAVLTWSPDARQILLTTKLGSYILDVNSFTPQTQRVNIQNQKDITLLTWELEFQKQKEVKIQTLPTELADILSRKAKSVVFAPDDSKILYTASADADLAEDIITPKLPGASTQKQERDIKAGRTYVFDLKEDRNFLVDRDDKDLSIEIWKETQAKRKMFWFATSRHIVLAEDSKISIMDLDGTNKKEVYSGNYVSPNALSAPSIDRLLILTNLGANSTPPNIYSLSLK